MALLSPRLVPAQFRASQHQLGSMFTLFLTSPVLAFCLVCHVQDVATPQVFANLQAQLNCVFDEIADVLYEPLKQHQRNQRLEYNDDSTLFAFCHDEFLSTFVLRFAFCSLTMQLHKQFKVSTEIRCLRLFIYIYIIYTCKMCC